jgi:hypothetical protein
MKIYRVYVISGIPPDIREKISEIHATCILKSRVKDEPVKIQSPDRKNIKTRSRDVRLVNKKRSD